MMHNYKGNKSHYPHPMENQSQDDFMEYSEHIIDMEEKDFNLNNCSERRDFDLPYVTYEAIEDTVEFNKGAQVKILKAQNTPETFMTDNESREKSLWIDVSIVTSEGNKWENGELPWNTILERLHNGSLKEVQRDVQWGIFEYKGILHASIKKSNKPPKECHGIFMTQLVELVEVGKKANLPYDKLKELAINSSSNEVDFQESVQKHCRENNIEFLSFSYRTDNDEINSLLNDVSMVLESSSNNEIKMMLAFVCRTMGSVKKSQASSSTTAEEFKTRVESSGHMEVMFAIIEESKVVQENLELYITKEKGDTSGTIPSA
jgi:hypothetical protein